MRKNYTYGYVRETIQEEDLNNQLEILKKYKCKKVFTEKISGTKSERPELNQMKEKVKSGDTIVIESFSRLGRSTKDLIELVEYFESKGVNLISIKENFNTGTPEGKSMLSVFQSFSQFERDLISERTREGLITAKGKGITGGRPKVEELNIENALELYNSKKYTINEIVEKSGISQATLYRYIKKKGKSQEDKPVTDADVEKIAKIEMYLLIENNSKFVRGIKKTTGQIENYLRYYYNLEKHDPDSVDYVFYIKYKTIEKLKDDVYDILDELERMADMNNCFTEGNASCEKLGLTW